MRVWRSAAGDGARHFKHIENMGGGPRGGGTAACESVAESDEHLKWKGLAANGLNRTFDKITNVTLEEAVSAPYTDKDRRIADVIGWFDEFDEALGRGIVVEVQHKNDSKDKVGTRNDYLKQDLSLVWTTANDFDDDNDKIRLDRVDFLARARAEARQFITDYLMPVSAPSDPVDGITPSPHTKVPATILGEYVYRQVAWEKLFNPPERLPDLDIWPYAKVPATIPDRYLYDRLSWSELFSPPFELSSEQEHVSVPASVKFGWVYSPIDYWYEQDWEARFRGTHDYIPTEQDDPNIEAKLPIDEYCWYEQDWSTRFRGTHDYIPTERTDPELKVKLPPEYFEDNRELFKNYHRRGKSDFDLVYSLASGNAPRRCQYCGGSADVYVHHPCASGIPPDNVLSVFVCDSCFKEELGHSTDG